MSHDSALRSLDSTWQPTVLARLFSVILLAAGFILAGSPARADIPDYTGQVFHNHLQCDPASYSHTTRLITENLRNHPSGVYLTLKNTKTGAVLNSDVATEHGPENVPGIVAYTWSWLRAGDDAVWGPDLAWATYMWPDGSTSWEQLTDVELMYNGSTPGNAICILWLPGF